MLYIDKATILKFDLEMLKKHRRAIQFIAVLLFIVGLLCISFPFVSGDILSTVVGALLICSGIALIVGLFLHPRTRAGHFCHCGIYCRFVLCGRGYSPDELVSSAFNERQLATARYWCAGYRHCLDIPWCYADGVGNAGFHTGGN